MQQSIKGIREGLDTVNTDEHKSEYFKPDPIISKEERNGAIEFCFCTLVLL
jgi:hypothetical protein